MRSSLKFVFYITGLFLLAAALPMRVFAQVNEYQVSESDRILISLPEANLSIQSSPTQKTFRILMSAAAAEEFVLEKRDGLFTLRSRQFDNKAEFGKWKDAKRTVEILAPSLPLEVHLFEGQLNLNSWKREAFLHLIRGKIISRSGSGPLTAHAMKGEIQVLDHQGTVNIDSQGANLAVRNHNGEMYLENFLGETLVEKSNGFVSLAQGQGSSRLLNGQGTIRFELQKGNLNTNAWVGRIEGLSREANINLNLNSDPDVSIRTTSGRVTVQAPPRSGAWLSLSTEDGDIFLPAPLKVAREGVQKLYRGRMKGENTKGSIVIRSTEGNIQVRN